MGKEKQINQNEQSIARVKSNAFVIQLMFVFVFVSINN